MNDKEVTDRRIAHGSIGYCMRKVDDTMKEAKNSVEVNYSGMYIKMNEDVD